MYNFAEVATRYSQTDEQKLKAKSLTAAKREASRRQMFQETVLIIFSDNSGAELSVKQNGNWCDQF